MASSGAQWDRLEDSWESSFQSFLVNDSILKSDPSINQSLCRKIENTIIVNAAEAPLFIKDYDQMLYKEAKDKNSIRILENHSDWTLSRFEKTLQNFKEQHPEYWDLLKLSVRVIVLDCLEPYGSASATDTIGIFSLNCKNYFEEIDIFEMLVHELTHNLAFIDNLNNPHFKSQKFLDQTLVRSPIRNVERPIHLAMHALWVAVELLHFRKKTNTLFRSSKIHPDSAELIENSIKSCEEIAKHQSLLTNRSLGFLDKSLKDLLEFQNACK